jgi:uncharacterized protein YgiM (DUF1202 family)
MWMLLPGLMFTIALTATAQESDNQVISGAFTGAITGDNVNVRAGAGRNYYAVTQLNEGAIVQVHDNLYDWYRITPPAGTFSYISKAYVEAGADGTRGMVTGENVRVRAPSAAGPDRSYKTQIKLNPGDQVTILGSAEGFYKIVPPAEAYLYVYKDYVTRATEQQRRLAEQAQGDVDWTRPDQPGDSATADSAQQAPDTVDAADAADATDDSTQTTDQVADASQASDTADPPQAADMAPVPDTAQAADATDDTADEPDTADQADVADAGDAGESTQPGAASQQLAQLEKRFAEMSAEGRPLADQPLERMAAAYRGLLDGGELTDAERKIARTRIDVLTTRQRLRDAMAELAQARQEADDAGEADAADAADGPDTADAAEAMPDPVALVVIAQEDQPIEPQPEYSAVGRLQASTLYTGDQLPLMFRLVDPLSNLTVAYITPPAQDRTRLLGRLVGVVGESRYDPALKLKIIDAQQIDLLSAGGN